MTPPKLTTAERDDIREAISQESNNQFTYLQQVGMNLQGHNVPPDLYDTIIQQLAEEWWVNCKLRVQSRYDGAKEGIGIAKKLIGSAMMASTRVPMMVQAHSAVYQALEAWEKETDLFYTTMLAEIDRKKAGQNE